MPTYTYKCAMCGNTSQKINRVANRKKGAPVCCDVRMRQTITAASMGQLQASTAQVFKNQLDPYTQEVVTNQKQVDQIRKRHGLMDGRELGKGKDYVEKRDKIKAERDALLNKDPYVKVGKFNTEITA